MKISNLIKSNWVFALSTIILTVGILILINVLSSFSHLKIDMTDDQRYSLSNEAKQFLDDHVNSLESTIYFEVYLDGELPSDLRNFKEFIEEKLQNFKEYTDGKIEYKFVDPKSDITKKYNDLEKEIYNNRKGIGEIEAEFTDYNGDLKKLRIWPGAKVTFNKNGATNTTYVQFIQAPFFPSQNTERQLIDLEGLKYLIDNAPDLELKLAAAIRELVTNKKRIGFLSGHNELMPVETIYARNLLRKNYYMKDVSIDDDLNKLNDFDALIVADPKQVFSTKDLYVIDQFVLRGGKLMVFMNTLNLNIDSLNLNFGAHTMRKRIGLEDMLYDYGIKVHENFVMDANCMVHRYKANSRIKIKSEKSTFPQLYHIVATPTKHPISNNLNRISLEFTNQLGFTEIDNPKVKSDSILISSSNSTVSRQAPVVTYNDFKRFGEPMRLYDRQPKSLLIGGMIQGSFKSYFEGKPWAIDTSFTNNPNSRYLKKSKKNSQLLVVGNGRFMANPVYPKQLPNGSIEWVAPNIPSFLRYDINGQFNNSNAIDNADFIENIVDYMVGDNASFIALRNRNKIISKKELDRKKISSKKNYYTFINIAIPLLIIVSIGAFSVWFRKRKFTNSNRNS